MGLRNHETYSSREEKTSLKVARLFFLVSLNIFWVVFCRWRGRGKRSLESTERAHQNKMPDNSGTHPEH